MRTLTTKFSGPLAITAIMLITAGCAMQNGRTGEAMSEESDFIAVPRIYVEDHAPFGQSRQFRNCY